MAYLLLAIICSSSIALIFKYSEQKELNRYLITSINYLIAFSISLSLGVNLNNSPQMLNIAFLGMAGGVFFFLSFVFYQVCIRKSGASLSGAFGKMGILLPMIFSIFIWNEIPGIIQWIGICTALFSIIMVYLPTKNVNNKKNISHFHYFLIFLFIFGGMAEFFNKIFQYYFSADYKSTFLFFLFITAFVISSLFVLTKNRKRPTRRDVLTGIIVGIPNYFSSYFLIISLDSIKASIAFPIYSAGSILLINLGSMILYREKLRKIEKIAIVLSAFALVLVNL